MPHTKISFSVFVYSLAILNHRKFGDSKVQVHVSVIIFAKRNIASIAQLWRGFEAERCFSTRKIFYFFLNIILF